MPWGDSRTHFTQALSACSTPPNQRWTFTMDLSGTEHSCASDFLEVFLSPWVRK